MTRTILVTGGTGYIGSHTVVELLDAEFDVVIVDNLTNSSPVVLPRIEEITARRPKFVQCDVRDVETLAAVFRRESIHAVIHFAALKAVGESSRLPLAYYDNNVSGTMTLIATMQQHGVKNLVFSSSATVYGEPEHVPVTEEAGLSATNPYGRTKLMMETIMRDVAVADDAWRVFLLRYFNPVGAHSSGKIGEDPKGEPNNLMPYVMQVAVGRRPRLRIFGNDYATPDGTGVRDYIHVVDLAKSHVRALERLDSVRGCAALNVGTGRGYSVMEVLAAASRVSGVEIPYEVVGRRKGDIGCLFADPSRAKAALKWRATLGLEQMVADHWRWQSLNPNGYES